LIEALSLIVRAGGNPQLLKIVEAYAQTKFALYGGKPLRDKLEDLPNKKIPPVDPSSYPALVLPNDHCFCEIYLEHREKLFQAWNQSVADGLERLIGWFRKNCQNFKYQ